MEKVDGLKKLVELGRSARNQSNMKIRQPLSQLSYAIENDAISSFVEENQAIILDELNVKSIERITDSSDLIQYKIKPNLKTLGRKYGKGLNRIRTLLNEVDTQQFIHDLNNSDIVVLDHENESFEFSKGDVFIETEAAEGFSAISDAGLTVGLSLTLSDDLIQEGLVRDLIRQVQMMRKEAGFAVEDRIKIYWELTEDISTAMLKFEGYFKTETLSIELIDGFQSGDFEQKIQVRENEIHIGIKKI
jgi:isoleucyl-tRNA synthetase